MADEKIADIVKYLFEAGQLKRVKRSGWWIAGIDNPESVAEHSFRAAVAAYIIAKMEGIDADKTAMTILFHDLPEARLNDLHKIGQRYIDFKEAEEKAFNEQVAGLPDFIRKDISGRIHYIHDDSTPEMIAAKDADLIECALQAREYMDSGHKDAQDWINNIRPLLKTKTAKKMLAEIEKASSGSWWHGLKNIKR